MKIAVLADVHGNVRALRMCLAYLKWREVDAYCFLGDYAGELPGVKETFDIIRDLETREQCYVIRGNKEDYLLNGFGGPHPEWDEYKSVVGMLRYGFEQTDEDTMKYIKGLPITMRLEFEGLPALRLCHGSPENTKIPVASKKGKNTEIIEAIDEDYILFGHTHRKMEEEHLGKRILNPGPVGVPVTGTIETECLILHGREGEWEPEFVSLAYDYEGSIRDMKAAGLFEIAPVWAQITKDLLRGGGVSHGTVLSRAMEMCWKETGKCDWPCVPEKYMQAAYDELVG